MDLSHLHIDRSKINWCHQFLVLRGVSTLVLMEWRFPYFNFWFHFTQLVSPRCSSDKEDLWHFGWCLSCKLFTRLVSLSFVVQMVTTHFTIFVLIKQDLLHMIWIPTDFLLFDISLYRMTFRPCWCISIIHIQYVTDNRLLTSLAIPVASLQSVYSRILDKVISETMPSNLTKSTAFKCVPRLFS